MEADGAGLSMRPMQKRGHSRLTCSIGRCDEHPPCRFTLGAPAVGEVLSKAWGRDLAPPLASHPNPKDQPTTFCAARRVRPEVGNFLTGKACIALPEDRSLPGQRRGPPLQAPASVAPTARPEQSPLWRHPYRLSNLDRPPTWRQVPFRARAKSSRKRASGAQVPGRELIVVNRTKTCRAG